MRICASAGSAWGFRYLLRRLGGVWAQEKDIYFCQTRSTYTLSYLPAYPAASAEDSSITYHHVADRREYHGPHTENIPHYT